MLLLQRHALAGQIMMCSALLMEEDWLVARPVQPSRLETVMNSMIPSVRLTNGLVSRTFSLFPNWATIDMRHAVTNSGLLRAVEPEGLISFSCKPSPDTPTRLGGTNVSVGGLSGQVLPTMPDFALDSAVNWTSPLGALQYTRHEVGPIDAPFEWAPQRHARDDASWPPKGLKLAVHFVPPHGSQVNLNATCEDSCWCGVDVAVVYEIFDGVPLISKSIVISNSKGVVYADEVVIESLAVVEHGMGKISIETDFPNPRKTFWSEEVSSLFKYPPNGSYAGWRQDYPSKHIDPAYQDISHDASVFGDYSFLKLLVQVGYPGRGPAQPICSATFHDPPPGAAVRFQTFRVLELLHDGASAGGGAYDDSEERRSLARRRMFRTLAPQTTENPLLFYSTDASNSSVALVAEQWSSIGGEAMLLGYGSGFNPSDLSAKNVQATKAKFEIAHNHSLLIGGYIFLQGPPGGTPLAVQCHNPDEPSQGINQADMSTAWYQAFLDRIVRFIELTGQDMLETDGPYEGAACFATNFSDFVSPRNSHSRQVRTMVGFYRTLKRRFGTYLTVPDPYEFTSGINKEPIGYTDTYCHIDSGGSGTEAALWESLNIGRAYYYDGTYHYPSTSGWMTFDMEHVDNRPPGKIISPARLQMLEWALAQYLGESSSLLRGIPNV
jgi:hypothetical protein